MLGSLESLPGPFAGSASSVSVLFPWGSLLRGVVSPEPEALAALKSLCRPGAAVEVVTALDPLADAGELERLGMAGVSFERMAAGWCEAGFERVSLEPLEAAHPYQTTWWRKIRQRETRTATRLTATVARS